jgi:MFS transporter, DHA1 family, solute carrier family 18 (vesicular amine transporter), member 1/2
MLSPVMADLAAVGHGMDGVGFAHVYGAFNLAYGLGNAREYIPVIPCHFSAYLSLIVGPIIGGQVYDHVPHGWSAICFISAGIFGIAAFLSFFFAGSDPLVRKVRRRLRPAPPEDAAAVQA